jgi:phosphoglycolate phosphatase
MRTAIIFDLDGTLVDSAPDLMDAHNFVMKKYGYTIKELSDIRFLAGRGAANMILRSVEKDEKKINKLLHQQMTNDFINYYRDNISKKSAPLEGVIKFLEWSKSKKILLGVCTNKLESLAKKLLIELDMIKYFDYIAGVDTFEYRKPDPRHLTNVLEILKTETSNSIMVGDSETDAETARSAKVKFVLVQNGYTEKNHNTIHHDFLIKDFLEMKDIVTKAKILN